MRMKCIAVACLCLVAVMFLTGCDGRDFNIEVQQRWYVDTSDTWLVSGYNGYKCSGVEQSKDGEGKYTVVLTFDDTLKTIQN